MTIILRQCNCLTEETNESAEKLSDFTGQFSKVADHKINTLKKINGASCKIKCKSPIHYSNKSKMEK